MLIVTNLQYYYYELRGKAQVFFIEDVQLRNFQKQNNKIMNVIGPMSQLATPSDYTTPTPRSPFTSARGLSNQNQIKYFSKVNSNLLIQWEGFTKNDVIQGSGTLKVSERSKDITKKGNLVFSLESKEWKDNTPIGDIKMLIIHYFQDKGTKGIVKQVRKYEGGCKQLCKHGYGEFTIEYHYSNETRDIVCVNGEWQNDFIQKGTIIQNGVEKNDVSFHHNIEMDTHKLNITRKSLVAPFSSKRQIRKSLSKQLLKDVSIENIGKKEGSRNFLKPPNEKKK